MGRVLKRGILLFAIGIFYSGGFTNPWPDMRLMGVLNRIALAYTVAGLLFCWFKPRTLVAICGGKGLRGPQASGILCGRRDLIGSAALRVPCRGSTRRG